MMLHSLLGSSRRLATAAALGLVWLVLHGLVAAAPARAGDADGASNLWAAHLRAAEDLEYQIQMARGDDLAVQAMESRGMRAVQRRRWVPSHELAVRAVEAYEAAAKARPDAAEPHHRAAEVLHAHFLDSPSTSADPVLTDRVIAERALAHWQAFAERAPLDPRVTSTLFDRALVRTRLATTPDFEQAVVCYETLVERADLRSMSAEGVATWLANLAETYMMVGRLADSIETYRRALEYRPDSTYGYGLAVALDRDGQTALAREVMLSYAAADRMRDLTRDGVFFVPAGEIEYYLALGHEALEDFDQAAVHYRRFIASGAHPRYQARATENLRRVEQAMARGSRRATPPRRSGRPGQAQAPGLQLDPNEVQ
ncbi:MAG TPA: tetratricopeptide repeat protein [Haliangium sp.]|nr:tetratricopeptide repeat protein [Haliangium sp.]